MVITRLALVLGFHQIITDVSRLGDGQTGSEWDGGPESLEFGTDGFTVDEGNVR